MAEVDPFDRTELRPYWQATMPALPDRRGRELPEWADVVVVGGGYTGVSCARTLARAGARVTLLEAETLGWGASTRNGGIVHPGYKWGPAELRARHGDELGTLLWQETLDGWAFLRRLMEEESIDAGLTETGHVELAAAWSHVQGFEDERDSLASMGVRAELLPRNRVAEEIATDAYLGALVIDGSGSLHPGRFFAGLVAAAERAGADLHDGVRAWLVSDGPGGGRLVHTTAGTIEAGEVVVATNGYTDGLVPALRRRIIPIGSYIIATEPLPDELVHELSRHGRPFFDTWNFLHYWQVRDGRMIFGGRASFRPTSFGRAARILHRALLEIHPQLQGRQVEYAWGGKVGFTWDRMPHIGRTSSGAWYAMGYSGTGVVMAPYLGHRLGEWLGGGPAPALSRLSFPLVPVPYEGRPWFLPFGGEWYRLKDRLAARSASRAR
jgi:glycine/D-amino acid oxidase-like deaminating enzyme